MMLIEMSMGAAAMILMGVILRSLFMNQVPKLTFMIIWGLVVIRLLIPFSIPTFWEPYQVTLPAIESIHTGETRFPALQEANSLESNEADSTPELEFISINWIRLIWISGVMISGLYIMSRHYKFRKQIADALPVDYHFKNNIQIRETDKIDSPLTYGILKPVILMPKNTDWSNEEQLLYVLTHEYIHIHRKDYLTKILLAAVLCLHWFNPLVWVMYILANRDIELSCDEAVLKILGRDKRSMYAMALLELEEKRSQMTVLAFSKNATEERVQVIIKMKKKTSLLGAAVALTLVGGAMMVFAVPSTPKVGAELNQSSNQTYTILNQTNFADFIEQNFNQVTELWGDTEEDMLAVRNGGVIIVQDGSRSLFFEEPEFTTAESFSTWMEQRLDQLKRLTTRKELNDIRDGMEATLARIENGETVMISPDGDWYTEFGTYVDWNEFTLGSSDNFEEAIEKITLTHGEFEVWAEEDLSQRDFSGEYLEEEIEVLRNRYSDLLAEYRDEEDVHFIIVDNELWGTEWSTNTNSYLK